MAIKASRERAVGIEKKVRMTIHELETLLEMVASYRVVLQGFDPPQESEVIRDSILVGP
jgi:hypothetical protein